MLYREAPEGRLDLLDRLDGFSGMRNGLRKIAGIRKEWAGIPMPLSDMNLVIESTYPKAVELMALGKKIEPDPDDEDATIRNRFWSWSRRCNIVVWEQNGKIEWGPKGAPNHLGLELDTLNASDAWGIEQEAAAIQTLAALLRHRQFKQYMLTGMFMEASARSGVHYLFRKLRPTIAITTRGTGSRILCALCLHPIGYYAGSWAGAMTPTDDVIAHLMLMRGDEHMFWRRANQHPPYAREAGI